MSQGKRSGRFSYLRGATENTQKSAPEEAGSAQEPDNDSKVERDDSRTKPTLSGGGKTKRATPASTKDELVSVPKGKGRMQQERSQLNVRLPTTLKRQATAKAVLEGRDIGEVVEELLRKYLE